MLAAQDSTSSPPAPMTDAALYTKKARMRQTLFDRGKMFMGSNNGKRSNPLKRPQADPSDSDSSEQGHTGESRCGKCAEWRRTLHQRFTLNKLSSDYRTVRTQPQTVVLRNLFYTMSRMYRCCVYLLSQFLEVLSHHPLAQLILHQMYCRDLSAHLPCELVDLLEDEVPRAHQAARLGHCAHSVLSGGSGGPDPGRGAQDTGIRKCLSSGSRGIDLFRGGLTDGWADRG